MYGGKRIAVVVPAFCEEKHIADVIGTTPDFVDHIVVVDDASPDGTAEAARSVPDPRLELVVHEVNQGVGGAVVTGHRRALELGADVSVVMAGDGQMDPAYLDRLLDPLVTGGYGFAKGNRFFSASSFQGMPRNRLFGNVVLTFMTKAASGYWDLVDPQNGYTAISRDVLERLPLDRISKRYEFENDLLIWLNILNVRAVDVAIPAVYGEEVSTMHLTTVIPRLLRLLIGGFWRRVWRKYVLWSFSPIALLLFAGSLLTMAGLLIGLWATIVSLSGSSPTAGTVLLAVTPFLVGVQMLTQALTLDIQATPK